MPQYHFIITVDDRSMNDSPQKTRINRFFTRFEARHVGRYVSPTYYPIPGTDLATGGVPTGAFQKQETTRCGINAICPSLTTTSGLKQKRRPGSKRVARPYAQSMLSRARTYGLWADVNSVCNCDMREWILRAPEREAQMYTNTKGDREDERQQTLRRTEENEHK